MKSLDLLSQPVNRIEGSVTVPGDKSMSHRAIILGSLAVGTTVINNFLVGEDCLATLNAFRAMGVKIDRNEQQIIIYGVGMDGLNAPIQPIDCGNSGTSMRLLAGLLAAQPFSSQLVGDKSLHQRPMLRISEPLKKMGADILTHDGKPPLLIKQTTALNAIHYVIPQASAQIKSCLLLAGLYAKGKTHLIETQKTRDHTERMLKAFSYPIEVTDKAISITGGGRCLATSLQIPGDLSSAAFFMVAATIVPDADLLLRNVGVNPTRTGVITILKAMGAAITIDNPRYYGEEPVADIHISSAALQGITIPPSLVPLAIDEFPIICIAAACAKGVTKFTQAKELRLKESDRISTMIEGLHQIGIKAEECEDGLSIEGGTINGGCIDSRGDHRIAMAFAIAGTVAKDNILIKNCANIATSFPNFVAVANSLNFRMRDIINNE